MHKSRLEAFSDGVFAILITIMVLELKTPQGIHLEDLARLIPIFLSYTLSFIYLGIYWNNHHHLFQAAKQVNGAILWANLHLLFWLSLVPFVTAWAGENHFAELPMGTYGFILLMCGVAYSILVRLLIREHGANSILAQAIGKDHKGNLSVALYVVAIFTSCYFPYVSAGLYITVAAIWLIPDSRIAKKL